MRKFDKVRKKEVKLTLLNVKKC